MSCKMRIAYFVHSLRSDWNNGNAHFLRGLLREMGALDHDIVIFEPRAEWSIQNLLEETGGKESLQRFFEEYPELHIELYEPSTVSDSDSWRRHLRGIDLVIVHEWNPPALAQVLLSLRNLLGFRMLFHDTHHRASSSPEQIRLLGVDRFDGIIVFGEVLRKIYRERFGITSVWTLHEAADTRVFHPLENINQQRDVVWVGNWGDEERSEEIREFLLRPAAIMPERQFTIYGVRYPEEAVQALCEAGVRYGGYLPNLDAPRVYSESRLTVHVPRRQYAREMSGIPTIRVFEALACGIPLISAPWHDAERLFRDGDMIFVRSCRQMCEALTRLLKSLGEAAELAARGRQTVLERHTCAHRATELTAICEEAMR